MAEDQERELDEAWQKCRALAIEPHILRRFVEATERAGVVGEARVVQLIYLAITSRLLGGSGNSGERPVSIAVKGPSSGGKSFTVESALKFCPESAYYALTGMSEHSLIYGDADLRHRHLVIYEATGFESETTSYLIRSLLSENRIRYETVEKLDGELKGRLIEREGPTGLIVTTTAVRLHPENETRLLSLTVSDTKDQTSKVFQALADESRKPFDYSEWHALQTWLERGERNVTIPFARELAKLVPPSAVRMRRDFALVLNLIRAHALLHRATRSRTADGKIIASAADYEAVRFLVADVVAQAVEATVSSELRETVEAVRALSGQKTDDSEVSQAEIGRRLNLDPSAVSRRIRAALAQGYLKNNETRKGRPHRLAIGEPLPADTVVLPTVEELLQSCSLVANEPPSPQPELQPCAVAPPEETPTPASDDPFEIPAWLRRDEADVHRGDPYWIE